MPIPRLTTVQKMALIRHCATQAHSPGLLAAALSPLTRDRRKIVGFALELLYSPALGSWCAGPTTPAAARTYLTYSVVIATREEQRLATRRARYAEKVGKIAPQLQPPKAGASSLTPPEVRARRVLDWDAIRAASGAA